MKRVVVCILAVAFSACASAEKREPVPAPAPPAAGPPAAGAPAAPAGPLLAQARPGGPGAGLAGPGRRPRAGKARGSVKDQERRVLADSYYQAGARLYRQMRYHEAATQLRLAVKADPNFADAQLMLDRTLYILGERGAGFRDEMRQLADETSVRIKLAQSEVERLYAQGQLHVKRDEYTQAIDRFERALETIRFFPFNIDQAGVRGRTEAALKLARSRKTERDLELKRELQRAAREDAAIQEQRNLAYHHARVRTLMQQARHAFDRTDYRLSAELCGQVLRREPKHLDALKLRGRAYHAGRLQAQLELIGARTEEMKRLIEGVYEAVIPYQEIFQFPSEEEWEKVQKRSLDLARLFETKGKQASAEEQRIRRTLDSSKITINFPGNAFNDALDYLRDVTGINYVVEKAAQEEIESNDPQITLKLRNITLKNALELILADAGGLIYRIRNDVVVINTKDGEKQDIFLRFYEVSEIVGIPPDNPAPRLALRPPSDSGDSGAGSATMLSQGEEETEIGPGIGADKLIELIEGKLGEQEGDVEVQFLGGLLMVRAPLTAHKKIEKLLDQLKRTTGIMVTVESQIIDVQDNLLEELGVDFTGLPALIPNVLGNGVARLLGFNFTNQGQTLDIRGELLNLFSQALGSAAGTPFNIASLGGGAFQYNVLSDFQLQALIDAVKRTQKARTVDASRITVFNGQRSHALTVSQKAYIADIEVNQTGVTPTINPVIGVLNSGSILEARPIVSYDRKFVTLEIQPTLAVNGTPVRQRLQLVQGAGGVNSDVTIELPVVSLSEIRTTVMVPDGGTVILGGLKNFLQQDQIAGLPIVRHVPLLHNLFERKGYTDLKRSLIVILKVDIKITREEEARRFNRQGTLTSAE